MERHRRVDRYSSKRKEHVILDAILSFVIFIPKVLYYIVIWLLMITDRIYDYRGSRF